MKDLFFFALVSAINPTLLAAATIMLTLERPKRLLLAYLAGGMIASVSIGLVIVFALGDSSIVNQTKTDISPAMDITVGLLAFLIAFVIGSGRAEPMIVRRKTRRAAKPHEPWSQRVLGRGSARLAFVVGVLLNLPGLYYLLALGVINDHNYSDAESVLLILGFNLIMFLFAEIPLLGYLLAPARTKSEVDRFNAWISRNGRRIAITVAAVIGAYLVSRGLLGYLGTLG